MRHAALQSISECGIDIVSLGNDDERGSRAERPEHLRDRNIKGDWRPERERFDLLMAVVVDPGTNRLAGGSMRDDDPFGRPVLPDV